ncbi:MAG: S8 family serine peptidase, partial [Actinobacteria bacterium]|nr:S8 family serine peptidase [Actinomycetota bacterium]
MKGRVFACLLAFAVVSALLPAALPSAASAALASSPEYTANRALVGAKRNERSNAATAVKARGGRVVSYYAPGNFLIVETPSDALEWAKGLQGNPSVRYAEPDYVLHASDFTPNDPSWSQLWGLQKIGMPQAWDSAVAGNRGSKSVVVGIIDTGVDYNHVDIGPVQMWANPNDSLGDRVDNDGNGLVDDYYGADCRNNDGDPMDDNNHGTHVAGTIGAATNNATGVAGINPNISIMALKFLSSSGSGATTDAIKCLDYAIAHGAELTSNSWGGGSYSQALRDAIKRARDANQLFIAAAGNDGKNTDVSPNYPSGYDLDNVVSVAATDSADKLASFSNYGVSSVDLGAPGVGILSTVRNNGYDTYSGTSMATPHVAGAAALLMAAYPGLQTDWRKLLDRLYGSVDPISALSGKSATGGRLNVARAIENDITPPGSTVLLAGASTPTSVSLSWTAPFEDGTSGLQASSYEFSYRPSGGAWASAPAPAPALPGTGQSQTVSGLKPGTNYDFKLTAKDNAANGSSETVTA